MAGSKQKGANAVEYGRNLSSDQVSRVAWLWLALGKVKLGLNYPCALGHFYSVCPLKHEIE